MEQVLEKVFLPNVFQAEALRALEKTTEKGGIVIMPTGTGKTFLASLWFKRILDLYPSARLLFVCHNRDILSQANEKEFQGCLRHLDIGFGYYTASRKEFKQCTFATTQTLTRSLSEFKEDYFDYIIVDEAHHYQARSFKKVLEHFKPKFTLGLTATPHRMDNKNIFKVIGKKIYEAKTCDAIKKGLLCKINYWSTDNDIDFSGVAWSGSNYNEKDLNRTICVKEYDDVILKEYNETLREKFQKKKTICFCATVEHTHRMAKLFNKNGIKAVGLTSKNKEGTRTIRRKERVKIINGFKKGNYDIIFVRDLFNEGIDIPSCDSIMMLRPTQSHTIFTQQIGRGLRTAEGKEDVLILDFTGNCRNCTINYDILEEITECDINEQIKKQSKRKESSEVVMLNNGCTIRLSRRKVDILKFRLDSLRMTLDMAIEKYHEIYKTKPERRELIKENNRIYNQFKNNNLLNKYCALSEKNLKRTIQEYYRDYKTKPSQERLLIENPNIYEIFKEFNILNEYCRHKSFVVIKDTITAKYIQEYNKMYKSKPTRGQLYKKSPKIYNHFRINNLLDKYCLPSQNIKQQPNIKITPTYKPITIIEKKKRNISGNPAAYSKDLVRKEYKSKEDKVDIREKILSNIQDGDKVLLLESPDLSAIKEIEKQGKSPSKIVIPNDKEFKKLAENIRNYKTDLNIEIINTSVLQYLVDTKEKFDFVWLDYCGAFSYYIEDLDILFQKHFNDMRLILTYNLFDPAKEDDSYYFTKVIDYVLNKVSGTNKIRLINDITYRYKKTMYNIGFEIGKTRT